MLKKRYFFVFFWLLLVVLLLSAVKKEPVSLIYALTALLIFTHVVYAGFYVINQSRYLDPVIAALVVIIYAVLALFAVSLNQPLYWFMWLGVVFVLALVFHSYYKGRSIEVYLQEFCNYKIYIEISGIICCFIGIAILNLVHPNRFVVPVLTLLCVLNMNYSIFIKRKLYQMKYQTEGIETDPLISIVIVAYNEEKYIAALLESLEAQDYKKYEIVVVDDKSTDRTVEIAGQFRARMPLEIVQKDIRGISRSRNFGASFAKGEVILFLDADVVLPPGFLRKAINVFVEEKLGIGGMDFIPLTHNKIDKITISFYRLWLRAVQYFNPRGIGFCMFVRKSIHEKTLFDETIIMSEDFDYVKRAAQFGKFRIITGIPPMVSWRRFQNENRFLLILKYLYFEWYRQNIGEIRKKIVPYEFGGH